MIALGLICLLAAAFITLAMLLTGTSQEVEFTSRIGDLTTDPLWIFVAGALTTLLVLAGLSFFSKGTRHKVARRKEMKRLRKVEKEHVQDVPASAAPTHDGGTRQARPADHTPTEGGQDRPHQDEPRQQAHGTSVELPDQGGAGAGATAANTPLDRPVGQHER